MKRLRTFVAGGLIGLLVLLFTGHMPFSLWGFVIVGGIAFLVFGFIVTALIDALRGD
jgi:hypothetical protein